MTAKLRPEHRKLWRRAYLAEFEGNGSSPEASRRIADEVVAQWEERGAFDVEPGASSTFNPPYGMAFPGDIRQALAELRACGVDVEHSIAIAFLERNEGFTLIPWSEDGKRLVDFAAQNSFAEMIALLRKEARDKALVALAQATRDYS